ncbi:MAG TPA: flagellar biosynthetic protein FliO [Firmicutes bacterium]|jgi:flagellar biosynthetic protein FliO|nr:flagellar biosynthetic protein FliO [Bacillota bacterium]
MKKLYLSVGVLLICLLLCSWDVVGATDREEFLPAYGGPEKPAGISPLRVIAQLFFSLALVIALFYLLARFLKARWGSTVAAKYLAVMDRLSLGTSRDIYILRIGSQFFVLGVTGDSISLLQKIDDPDLLLALQEQEQERSFARVLARQRQGVFLPLSKLEEQLEGIKKRGKSGSDLQQGKEQ